MAFRYQFAWIGVAQFVETEATALGDAQALGQRFGRIDRRQCLPGSQVVLAIGEQAPAGLGHGAVVADRSQHVLQGAAAAHVHVHIAGGHQPQAVVDGLLLQVGQHLFVVRATVQFQRQPQAVGEHLFQPVDVGLACRTFLAKQAAKSGCIVGKVLTQASVLSFLRPSPGGGDQLAQGLVAGQRLAQQHQLRPVFDLHFCADHQPHTGFLRRLVSTHDPGQRAFVGDRQRGIALFLCALEQLLCRRGPALEGEGGQAMQFRIGRRVHANQPCSMNGPRSPGAVKAQARWPSRVRST